MPVETRRKIKPNQKEVALHQNFDRHRGKPVRVKLYLMIPGSKIRLLVSSSCAFSADGCSGPAALLINVLQIGILFDMLESQLKMLH